VQNTDAMLVTARFTSGDAEYQVTIDRPMPRHPLGRYTTWSGVSTTTKCTAIPASAPRTCPR
jgi:hypothetical protein